MAERILAKFQKRTAELCPELLEAAADRDAERTGSLAHSLKGAAANVSAVALAAAAAELEEAARGKRWDNADDLARVLEQEWRRFSAVAEQACTTTPEAACMSV
ncbi:MAG: Hpt domain-containing protein [Planctomycetes bacterium]|nr:Hpt domain-containing protein [Planctomycetota bacterium]